MIVSTSSTQQISQKCNYDLTKWFNMCAKFRDFALSSIGGWSFLRPAPPLRLALSVAECSRNVPAKSTDQSAVTVHCSLSQTNHVCCSSGDLGLCHRLYQAPKLERCDARPFCAKICGRSRVAYLSSAHSF